MLDVHITMQQAGVVGSPAGLSCARAGWSLFSPLCLLSSVCSMYCTSMHISWLSLVSCSSFLQLTCSASWPGSCRESATSHSGTARCSDHMAAAASSAGSEVHPCLECPPAGDPADHLQPASRQAGRQLEETQLDSAPPTSTIQLSATTKTNRF